MRFQRLELRAFGLFSGHPIDLSEGREGLHLIYGPNEAGKSTALRAITQFLYGIPSRSGDDFVHAYANLRIGATLVHDGRTLSAVRRKGRAKTLRDERDEDAVDDQELERMLGPLDQATFEMMFGLNHHQLVQGGQMILEGKGALGQSLFAASAGLAGLRDLQTQLDIELADLFLPGKKARNPKVNEAIRSYEDAKKAVRAASISPTEWSRHDKELRQALERRSQVEAELEQCRVETGRLERIRDALPLIVQRQAVLERLALAADAVLLPEDFAERRNAARQSQHQAEAAIRDAQGALQRIREETEGLDLNENLLAQEEAIEAVWNDLGANRKAVQDRDRKLLPELEQLERQAQTLLEDIRPGLGLEQAAAIRLTSAERRRIRDLAAQGESLRQQHANAIEIVQTLQDTIERNRAALEALGEPGDPSELNRAIRRAQQRGLLEDDLRDLRQAIHQAETQAAIDLKTLGLWQGSLDALEQAPIPNLESIARFRRERENAQQRIETLQQQGKSAVEEEQQVRSEIETLRRETEVPTEQALEAARGLRDAGWRLVREHWENALPPTAVEDEPTRRFLEDAGSREEDLADAFESTLEHTDTIADRLRRESERVATLAQLETAQERAAERCAQLEKDVQDAQAAQNQIEAEWLALWQEAGIVPLPPQEMEGWARQRAELVADLRALREKRAEAEQCEAAIAEHRHEVQAALTALECEAGPEDERLDALLERAQDRANSSDDRRRRRQELTQSIERSESEDLPKATRAATAAESAWTEWQSQWTQDMKRLGLDGDATPPQANAVLDRMDELFQALDKGTDLRARIEQIETQDRDFTTRVRELTQRAAPEYAELPPEEALQNLHQALRKSRDARTSLNELDKQHKTEEKRLSKAKKTLDDTTGQFALLCEEARVPDPEALPQAIERSRARAQAESELATLDERLAQLSAGAPLDTFLTQAQAEDPDTLEPRIARLHEEAADHEQARTALSEAIGRERELLAQMDGSAAAAQAAADAEALLAAIARGANHYARLKLAESLLGRAIDRFRERNQGPLLERAGRFFATLTAGAFEQLRGDYTGKGEAVLTAVRAGGQEALHAGQMSDGAADQLYLALRLASLDSYLEHHPPIPFIADDILVNFDDQRAAAALDVLATLAQRTQVIFFTHHRHLVGLARNTIAPTTLFVHELPPMQPSRP